MRERSFVKQIRKLLTYSGYTDDGSGGEQLDIHGNVAFLKGGLMKPGHRCGVSEAMLTQQLGSSTNRAGAALAPPQYSPLSQFPCIGYLLNF